jgi:hypothetical protein
MKHENEKHLAALVIGGLLLRLCLIPFTNVNLDEGNMIFDAKFLWEGLVPFRDFMTRSLSYLYPLALFAKLCDLLSGGAGFSLLIGRIFSALCITLVSFFMYHIGQKLFSVRAGLLACAMVSFSPAFIYHSYTVNMHSANFLYVCAGISLLLHAFEKNQHRLLPWAGLLLGLAVLARRSSLLVLAAILVYLLIRKGMRAGNKVRITLSFLLPAAALVIPVYAILIHLTNWPFIMEHGAYGRVARHFLLPVLPHHLAVINNFAIENSYLALPLAALLFVKAKRMPQWFLPLIVLSLAGAAFWIGGLSRPIGGYGARAYPELYQLGQLVTLAILSLAGYRLAMKRRAPLANGTLLPLLWLTFLLVTYLSYNQLHIHYLYECLPPLVLLAARSLDLIFPSQTKRLTRGHRAALVMTLAAAVFSLTGMYSYFDPAYGWKQSTLREVSRQLNQVAAPGEEVFTAGTVFALEAGLRPCLRITHPYDYLSNPAPYRQLAKSPLPDIPGLVKHLESGKIRLVIADQLTYGLIGTYPELLRQVMSNYLPVVDIDNVKIGLRMDLEATK